AHMLKRVSVSPSVVESAAQESPDLLWLNGKDLRRLPLAERKEILRDLVKQPTFLRSISKRQG
ncbi:MAG: hypothetical protein WBC04_18750, partial [Candidatus Acidiferrales bacterium]